MPVGIRARRDGSSRPADRNRSGSRPDRRLRGRPEAVVRAIADADRRLGAALRSRARRAPVVVRCADLTATGMSAVFRLAVALAIIVRPTRAAGVEAAVAAELAARIAGAARARLGRPRPAPSADAGFPSRHAAAAAAIISVAAARDRRAGIVAGGAAAVGLTGRVLAGRHEPADIAAGVVVGLSAAALVRRCAPLLGGGRGTPPPTRPPGRPRRPRG